MAAQFAFTALLSRNEALLAKAVVGLPGLTVDNRFGTFRTWTQANERARQLNQRLGLTPSQGRAIVTEVLLEAQSLILECDSLMEMARQLRQGQRHPGLGCVLAQLELGVTFCYVACTRHNVRKDQLLQDARKVLRNALRAIDKFEFSLDDVKLINAGINHLQRALDENALQPKTAL
jgi:hypothetical protein